MAEHQPEIGVLIRRVSSDMEPITLEEVKSRAERLEHGPTPLVGDQAAANGTPLLGSDELIALARHRSRAADSVVRRRARITSAAAAVALAAGILLVVGVVADGRDGDRISSTGPGFELSEDGSTTTSSSTGTIGSTTVPSPAEQPLPVVTLETGFKVLALMVLDDGRLAVAGEGDTMQFWDPGNPDAGPTEVRLEDAFGAGSQTRSVAGIGRLPSGGLVVTSSFPDSVTVEEIDPSSGSGLLGSQLTQDVVRQPAVTMLRDGHVAVGGTEGMVTIEAAGEGGVRFKTAHTGTVLAVAELPDGSIVSGGGEGTIRIWDRATGVEDERSPVPVDHSDAVTALVVLADGRVASGDSNGAIRIWNADRPDDDPRMLDGHGGTVTDLVELPDGRVASASADGTVRVWNPDEPDPNPAVLDHADAVNVLAVLPDGRLAAGGSDDAVRVWVIGGSARVPSVGIADDGSNTDSPGPGGDGDPFVDSGTGDDSVEIAIPVLTADRAPTVVQCESGPPDFPPNDGESDLQSSVFPTPEKALDDVLDSISHGGRAWKAELVRIDTPDGSINYAAPVEVVLPVGSQPVDEALLLVVVRPSGSGEGYTASRWEMVGC